MLKHILNKIIRVISRRELIPVRVPISDEKIFENKTALITGGCGGIGFAIAELLASRGCEIIITGTDEAKLKKTLTRLNGAKGLLINLLDINSIDENVEKAYEISNNGKIDILINAAGLNNRDCFLKTSISEFEKIMTVNLEAVFFMTQSVAKRMIDLKTRGHILNVSSSSALRPAWSPYRLSKCAINGLTKGLADVLLPYGIVVNAIAPGPTATPMMNIKEGDSIYNSENPSGRYATSEEVAYLAAYLVSDLANMVVGDTFYITGGSGVISYHR